MNDRSRYEDFWERALVQLLHPTQLLIVEAIIRLGRPISASIMVRISEHQIPLASYDYHCKRLTELGLLKPAGEALRRGTCEKFYDFKVCA